MCLSSFAWHLGLLLLAQTEQVRPTLQFINPQHLTRISKPLSFYPFLLPFSTIRKPSSHQLIKPFSLILFPTVLF